MQWLSLHSLRFLKPFIKQQTKGHQSPIFYKKQNSHLKVMKIKYYV